MSRLFNKGDRVILVSYHEEDHYTSGHPVVEKGTILSIYECDQSNCKYYYRCQLEDYIDTFEWCSFWEDQLVRLIEK